MRKVDPKFEDEKKEMYVPKYNISISKWGRRHLKDLFFYSPSENDKL